MLVGLLVAACVALVGCERKADEVQRVFPSGETTSTLPEQAELLATNTVTAQYVGTVEQPCRFMTALCPDKCGHGTRLAQFHVISNDRYDRPGKYGDDKMNAGDTVSVDVAREVPGQSPSVAALISRLQPGEVVRFTVNHYYVTQGQGQFPVRPVVSIERCSVEP